MKLDFYQIPIEKLGENFKIIIYGAGEIGIGIYEKIRDKVNIICFVDKKYQDIRNINEISVCPPWELRNLEFDFVIVAAHFGKTEIQAYLFDIGIISKKILQLEIIDTKYLLTSSGPISYSQDGLLSVTNSDFMQDERFIKAYQLGRKTGSWGNTDIHWRMHVACWAASLAMKLDGDFIECGVNKGGLATTVIEYINFGSSTKTFFLLDTFEGLVEEQITSEEKKLGIGGFLNTYEGCYEDVLKNFKKYNNVHLIKGIIPNTLTKVNTNKISFLHIDMNCVEPEIAAAEFFWNKVVSGGVVLLDDYGWYNHLEQKKALDTFARSKGIEILSLPTGQGLIIKP